jgi:hypothetical protein
MFDVQAVDRAEFKRHQQTDHIEADMADEPQDPDAAADRLEAALERIARLSVAQAARIDSAQAALTDIQQDTAARAAAATTTPADDALSIPEIVQRLDSLIGRLRAALATTE